jgi:uncharacterized protein DUF5658
MSDVPAVRTPPRVRLILLLYVLFITFHAFDAWSTVEAMRNGAVELNPVMAALLARGTATFVVAKMGVAVVGGFVLAYFSRRKRLAWYGLIGVTVVFGAVAAWHVALVLYGPQLTITLPA